MPVKIHPQAVVASSAELGADVEVGPFSVIGHRVEIGDRCRIGAGAMIEGPTKMGADNVVFSGACLGFEPQDLKFAGEQTYVEIGDGNHFREHCTVHRGTGKGGGLTRVGSHNLFMVGAHIAHDCMVGDHTIFANNGTLAGHVEVGDHATIGAFTSVHQFCRVGPYAYIGGYSVVTRDALPYVKTVGTKPVCYGINRIGLERKGFSGEELKALDRAFRLLIRSRQALPEAIEAARGELGDEPRVRLLIDFLQSSERGVITDLPGRKKSRRGG